MTRTELLSVLQEETDGFESQSRLRDDVIDAMEVAYLKGKKEQLILPDVRQQGELLKAFLAWRLDKPYSDFQTQEYDIGEFLKVFNCAQQDSITIVDRSKNNNNHKRRMR